jgi:hypothetical protein
MAVRFVTSSDVLCGRYYAVECSIVVAGLCARVRCCPASQAERDAALREAHTAAEQLRRQLVGCNFRRCLLSFVGFTP